MTMLRKKQSGKTRKKIRRNKHEVGNLFTCKLNFCRPNIPRSPSHYFTIKICFTKEKRSIQVTQVKLY